MIERKLLAIFVGEPMMEQAADGSRFRTSLYKNPVCETIWLGSENLEGNHQADLRYHGGPDKAVCCFASEHYGALSEFVEQTLKYGALGENFTFSGMLENDSCLGDQYRIGDAIVEVSQPRQPCGNLARRWGKKQLPKFMVQRGYTGFYVRVIEEGLVQPGEPVELLERPQPQWTIAAMNHIMFVDKTNQLALEELVTISQLSEAWRRDFAERLATICPKF